MAYSNRDMLRYKFIRTFLNHMYPNLITPFGSGLPKKPLIVGFKDKMLRVKPSYALIDRAEIEECSRGLGIWPLLREVPVNNQVVHKLSYGGNRVFTFEEDLQFFCRIYCQGLRYWLATSKPDSQRYGFIGRSVGPVSIADRQHAVSKLNVVLAKGGGRARYLKLLQKERADAPRA